ncbi:LON peptidase N-terminal domain and RING finger protein 1 [Rhineura floridana]|uniref:LON peptidase N-terminal domain and RING finger protein 1 n=1 Tax=Rhineura floridana TaxID=261503 RepID=UPI002AC7F1D8|nr:LON peptidase N-terminal domain and RING finger protein 1 [Rhineura floridana]
MPHPPPGAGRSKEQEEGEMASSPVAVSVEMAPEPGGSGVCDGQSEQERLLRRGELLALGNRLKEALETYSAALRLGPPPTPTSRRRMGKLVDCLVAHYRLQQRGPKACAAGNAPGEGKEEQQLPLGGWEHSGVMTGLFSCCGCQGFLGEPVTVPCGHTYCRRCLHEELRACCPHCGDPLAPSSVAVVLSYLAEKWFPGECKRVRTWRRLGELLGQGHLREAHAAASQALMKDPNDLMLRVYRAESYAGFQELKSALDDLNAVITIMPNWPEVYFRKAKILHNGGSVDDALPLFLHCLALDEEFLPAKLEVEKMLCDLLSPENVRESLKESTLNSLNSSHVQSKPFIHGSEMEESYDNLQLSSQPDLEVQQVPSEPVGRNLHRAKSAHSLNSTGKNAKDDGLKRVSSEPLLSSQDKGALLKRKLSLSEQDVTVSEDGRNKHKKQGETAKRDAAFPFNYGPVPQDLIDASDFECSLCMRLFFHPVTTPCGHTFCKNCLERCLDHTPQCPLCKESLKEYLASRKYRITQLLEELIVKYLPAELSERKRINDEETAEYSNLTKNVPIFVCTMAYPTVPCPLHVFEPRYRLMIRRSIETGTKQFGMCISDPKNGFADYGCMLYIRNLDYLPDGRSVVDTVGLKRFRVLQRGMKDGYCTADIEYLEDTKVEDEGEMKKLGELHKFVYSQACSWFQSLRNKFRSQILQHFGPMPEREGNIQEMANGPAWCWWLLAVLPVDPRYQLSVLSMRSLKERLIKIQDILTYFSRDQ